MRILDGFRVALLILPVFAAACDRFFEDRANLRTRLVELKSERTALVDQLYGEYGGGTLARSLRDSPRPDTQEHGAVFRDLVTSVVTEGDRSLFEEQIRTVGRGDRPVTLSSEAREFLSLQEIRLACQRVVRLDYEIEDIEKMISRLEKAERSVQP